MSTHSPRRVAVRPALAAAAVIAAAVPAVALAAPASYTARSIDEPASAGLAVSGRLSEFRASAHTRVIVPSRWSRISAGAGRLHLRARQNESCTYDLTYRATSVLAPAADAATRVATELPSAGRGYLLDEGTRGSRAFRVVREKTTDGRTRLTGLWTGVLTKRDDIVPSGKVAWAEIRVSAVSRAGDECHTGTYRSALGPDIGDSLADARADLRFTESP